MLAESFEATDPSTWVVKLKPDVEFHNGKTVTADDLIFSIKRIIDPKTASRGGGGLAIDRRQEPQEARRPARCRSRSRSPNSVFDTEFGQYFNGIVPTDYDPKKPVGTGPYKADTFTAGQQARCCASRTTTATPGYVDKITITELADAGARVNALLGGQVDAIAALPGAPGQDARVQQAIRGAQRRDRHAGSRSPCTSTRSRSPTCACARRCGCWSTASRCSTQVLNGYGQLGNDTWGRTDPTYNASLPQREQDLEQAKALLQQAGQSDLHVELTTSPFYEGMVSSAQVFVEQAKAAGVTVKLTQLDTDAFLAELPEVAVHAGLLGHARLHPAGGPDLAAGRDARTTPAGTTRSTRRSSVTPRRSSTSPSARS